MISLNEFLPKVSSEMGKKGSITGAISNAGRSKKDKMAITNYYTQQTSATNSKLGTANAMTYSEHNISRQKGSVEAIAARILQNQQQIKQSHPNASTAGSELEIRSTYDNITNSQVVNLNNSMMAATTTGFNKLTGGGNNNTRIAGNRQIPLNKFSRGATRQG